MDKHKIIHLDDRRDLIIPGDHSTTIQFCTEHWISLCNRAIADHDAFYVALSGGSTPKAIFERIASPAYHSKIDWSKVHLFWSDERAVPPEHPDSNFHMAMQAGLGKMPIPKEHIHRMHAETDIEANALTYEKTIKGALKNNPFDLVMLGMGGDGHTASLFPNTRALHAKDRLVVANFLPDKNTWRMTFTFECINHAAHITIYVLGADKKSTLYEALKDETKGYPIQKVGTAQHHALWIADEAAAAEL